MSVSNADNGQVQEQTYLMTDFVEDGDHVAHVIDGKHRVQQLALHIERVSFELDKPVT